MRASRGRTLDVALVWRDVWGKTTQHSGDKFYAGLALWAKGQGLGRNFENLPTEILQPTESAVSPRRPPSRPRSSATSPRGRGVEGASGGDERRARGRGDMSGDDVFLEVALEGWTGAHWCPASRVFKGCALFAAVIATGAASFPP